MYATDKEAVLLCAPVDGPMPVLGKPLSTTADDDMDRALVAVRRGRVLLGAHALDPLVPAPAVRRGVFCTLGASVGQYAGAQADLLKKEWADQRKGLQAVVDEQMKQGRAQWQKSVREMQDGTDRTMQQAMKAMTLGGAVGKWRESKPGKLEASDRQGSCSSLR